MNHIYFLWSHSSSQFECIYVTEYNGSYLRRKKNSRPCNDIIEILDFWMDLKHHDVINKNWEFRFFLKGIRELRQSIVNRWRHFNQSAIPLWENNKYSVMKPVLRLETKLLDDYKKIKNGLTVKGKKYKPDFETDESFTSFMQKCMEIQKGKDQIYSRNKQSNYRDRLRNQPNSSSSSSNQSKSSSSSSSSSPKQSKRGQSNKGKSSRSTAKNKNKKQKEQEEESDHPEDQTQDEQTTNESGNTSITNKRSKRKRKFNEMENEDKEHEPLTVMEPELKRRRKTPFTNASTNTHDDPPNTYSPKTKKRSSFHSVEANAAFISLTQKMCSKDADATNDEDNHNHNQPQVCVQGYLYIMHGLVISITNINASIYSLTIFDCDFSFKFLFCFL